MSEEEKIGKLIQQIQAEKNKQDRLEEDIKLNLCRLKTFLEQVSGERFKTAELFESQAPISAEIKSTIDDYQRSKDNISELIKMLQSKGINIEKFKEL